MPLRNLARPQTLTSRLSRLAIPLLVVATASVWAGPREQALQIHNRVAGTPPSETVLLAMADHIEAGNTDEAVRLAMDTEGFYRATLKTLVTPWTNREQTPFAPLNDYTATVMGLVRDGADFREVLWEDVLYTSNAPGLPAYNTSDNAHYQALEAADASIRDTLVRRSQSAVTGLPAEATAGVMTSRAAAREFFYLGTNRAMFRFTLLAHLCRDLEQVHDTTRTPDRIRQDVSRSPGGDSRVFLNNCVGCHNGMDPLAQAYAYYNYDFDPDTDPDADFGQITYNGEGQTAPATGTRVVAKYHINATTFAPGYVTPDDQWDNYWRAGPNAILAWDESLPGSGEGAKSMGRELAHSGAFASCQVEKVFKAVCLREPGDAADRSLLASATDNFVGSGYNLQQVFIDTADYCKGE